MGQHGSANHCSCLKELESQSSGEGVWSQISLWRRWGSGQGIRLGWGPTVPDHRLKLGCTQGAVRSCCLWRRTLPFSTCGPQLEWKILGATTLSIAWPRGLPVAAARALMENRWALGKSTTISMLLLHVQWSLKEVPEALSALFTLSWSVLLHRTPWGQAWFLNLLIFECRLGWIWPARGGRYTHLNFSRKRKEYRHTLGC